LKFWILLIMGAVSPFLFMATLPSPVVIVLLLCTALCSFKLANSIKVFCLFPFCFLIVTLAINHRIAQRLPLSESKSHHQVSGVIGGLPVTNDGGARFLFLPDEPTGSIPSKIYVSWYEDRHRQALTESNVPPVRAGERWRLQLVLRSPRGRVNFQGSDAERWYFTQGIGALAYVRHGDNVRLSDPGWLNPQHWRELVLDKLNEKAGEKPAFRILAALAIADRRGLLKRDKDILSGTGTGHLLAISGLHIGLAAVLGYYLGRLGLLVFSSVQKQRLAFVVPWVTTLFASFFYAALSGFGISTQRALIMLTLASFVLLSKRNVHPLQAWLIAMSLVLLADPFAPLRAGFWFSFIAVGVLLMLFVPRQGHTPVWKKMLLAQFGISLIMAPLGMYWFQQASLPGLLANLLAIPVVSFLIVPPILVALVLIWLPGPLAEWVLTFAAYCAHWLLLTLDYLSTLQPPGFRSTRVPGLVSTLLAMLGAAIFMLPRGTPGRLAGLLLMFPLLLPASGSPQQTETRIDFLDVGQGLSVLLSTQDYLLVYDTGPGNGLNGEAGLDMVTGTIQPMIRATGKEPDLVVASHGDLDHAGGLERLRSEYPDARYIANLPVKRGGVSDCNEPLSWVTGNLEFRILHPSASLPYLGNDSSCVISVTGPGLSLLLSGDISRAVEQRLVDGGLDQHAILTAPHHGSSTSSSQALIEAVSPEWVLVSAAHGNRFGFPRADVLKRYSQAKATILNTAQCGGIRLTSDAMGGLRIDSARVSRNAIWRWPADQDC